MRNLIKKSDLKSPPLEKMWFNKVGQRGLTTVFKREFKKAKNYRCEECGKKKEPAELQVDHKKAIYKHSKGKILDEINAEIRIGKRKGKMNYDNLKNLQLLCITCHQNKSKKEAGGRSKGNRRVNKDGIPIRMIRV